MAFENRYTVEPDEALLRATKKNWKTFEKMFSKSWKCCSEQLVWK